MGKISGNILLSFIIPVYNVELYLQECIDSIVQQWDERCEIILVDDGSTDSSGEICDQNMREGIRVIHKENEGPSSARNIGLQYAMGRYISFLDADDRIANNAIPHIINWIQDGGADYCFMQGIKFYPDGALEDLGDCILRTDINDKAKFINYLASRPKFSGSAGTKLYRKSFLEKKKILFPQDRRLSEDLGFTRDCILKAETYDVLEVPFYQYRQNRNGSRTTSCGQKTTQGLLMFIQESVDLLTDCRKPKNDMCQAIMSFVSYEYAVLLLNYCNSDVNTKRSIINQIKKYKWTLKYARTMRLRGIRILSFVLGVRLTAHLLYMVKK